MHPTHAHRILKAALSQKHYHAFAFNSIAVCTAETNSTSSQSQRGKGCVSLDIPRLCLYTYANLRINIGRYNEKT
jgi:hypothetical protein